MKQIDYFNKKAATIAVLRDWRDQHWKAGRGKQKVSSINNNMASLHSHSSSTPVKGGVSHAEEALCNAIDKKVAAEYGLKQAEEYIAYIAPCWERLTQEEQDLLTYRFIDYNEQNGIKVITEAQHIGKSEAYRRSDKALERLTKLLFW